MGHEIVSIAENELELCHNIKYLWKWTLKQFIGLWIENGLSCSLTFWHPQDQLNFTAVTSSDIQEMEHVREHLQSMLKNARGFLENEDFDAAESNTTTGRRMRRFLLTMSECLIIQ